MINKDRKPANLAYDERLGSFYIFDHGNCLFGAAGKRKVKQHRDLIGIGNHCLAQHITSLTGYREWINKINMIPDPFVKSTVDRSLGLGYSADDCEFLYEAICHRKRHVHSFAKRQLGKFPKLSQREKVELNNLSFGPKETPVK